MATTYDDLLENLKKPSSMYLETNWTLHRLQGILKSSISSTYNISVWATDISYLTTELTEAKEIELYIIGLETIENVEEVKSMLQTIKDAIELDFPDSKFICKRKLNKAAYELFTTTTDVTYESVESVSHSVPEELVILALPIDYQSVKNPIIFLDENYADFYEDIHLQKGTLSIERVTGIARYLPYYTP